MPISTEVIKRPNSPYADVNIKTAGGHTRYFQVQTQNADTFAIQYKKQDEQSSKLRNYACIPSIIVGVLATTLFTKSIKSKFQKFAINTAGGILASYASIAVCDKYSKNKEKNMIKHFGAKETYFEG